MQASKNNREGFIDENLPGIFLSIFGIVNLL
jgi:hypothetical protein